MLVVVFEQLQDAQSFQIVGGSACICKIASGLLVGLASCVETAFVSEEGGVPGMVVCLD
jgi:hypothetical protein